MKPKSLAAVCVFSLSVGLQLLFFLLFPSWYPAVQDRIADGNLGGAIFILAGLCVASPVALLYLTVMEGQEVSRGGR